MYLVLTRRVDEDIEIHFGDQMMRLHVCEVRSGQVKLGFDGPPAMKVYRSELPPEKRVPKKDRPT